MIDKISIDKIIFDASAALALLNQENGYKNVEKYIENSVISTVNLSEVFTVLTDLGMTKLKVESIVLPLVKEIIPFDQKQALVSAELRKITKSRGLSFGDRACLGLAKLLNLPVLTTDKAWANIPHGIEIILIR